MRVCGQKQHRWLNGVMVDGGEGMGKFLAQFIIVKEKWFAWRYEAIRFLMEHPSVLLINVIKLI